MNVEALPKTTRIDHEALAKRLLQGPMYASPTEVSPRHAGSLYQSIKRYCPGYRLKARTAVLITTEGTEVEVTQLKLTLSTP